MKTNTKQLLSVVKAEGQDFEWYPTTPDMIDAIRLDLNAFNRGDGFSLLDCGAGDGRVLNALATGKKYAIEKSKPLLNALDRSIFVVGTEFAEQTLIDKKVDVVFSNPPYSEFEAWAEKIILEANASRVYLVIPQRWENSERIKEALERRQAEATVIKSSDFLTADRQARAKVHIVRVALTTRYHRHNASPDTDPFSCWFHTHFKLEIGKREDSKHDIFNRQKAQVSDSVNQGLVAGTNLVSVLEECYQADLGRLMGTYLKLCDVDPELLKELNVNLKGVMEALQQKIEGLKDLYWKELFNRLDKVTDRLTSKSREALLGHLTSHTHVDFTVSNAHAVVLWVIKNANTYYDDQLIETFEKMVEKANIQNYKSNQRTFGAESWRYNQRPQGLEKFKLDYRVVLERCGGLYVPSWNWDKHKNQLSERAATFVDDLRTIADNLGFVTSGQTGATSREWTSGKKQEFVYVDRTGKRQLLMAVKAFKNGNLHIQFNQDFICKLNVEFGRLKGWLKNHHQAADELGLDEKKVADWFGSNLQLEGPGALMLGLDLAA